MSDRLIMAALGEQFVCPLVFQAFGCSGAWNERCRVWGNTFPLCVVESEKERESVNLWKNEWHFSGHVGTRTVMCTFLFVTTWNSKEKTCHYCPESPPLPQVTSSDLCVNAQTQCGLRGTVERLVIEFTHSLAAFLCFEWDFVKWPTRTSESFSHQWTLMRFRTLAIVTGLVVDISIFFLASESISYSLVTTTMYLQNPGCLFIGNVGLKSGSWFKAELIKTYIFLLFITISPKLPWFLYIPLTPNALPKQ